MTTNTIRTAPPNSLVLISDAQGAVVPDPNRIARNAGIISTNSCVAVCCQAAMDGETEITIGPALEVDPGDDPEFDRMLMTPTRIVAVSTIEWKSLLNLEAPSSITRLRIWTNHPREPNKVIVGLG